VPWGFDDEAIAISKNFTALHASYTPYIMKLFKRAVDSGEPVNAPLWWIAPTDEVAQSIYDGNSLTIVTTFTIFVNVIMFSTCRVPFGR